MSASLYIYQARELPMLSEALAEYVSTLNHGSRPAYALLYSPRSCRLTIIDNGKAYDSAKNEILLDDVFEARVFNSQAELRWLHDARGRGSAVVLSESSSGNFFGNTPAPEPDIVDCLETTYLLWGKRAGNKHPAGWTRFATARIGTFDVPLPDVQEYAQFTAREYLKEYVDGNVCFAEERLTGLIQMHEEKQNG